MIKCILLALKANDGVLATILILLVQVELGLCIEHIKYTLLKQIEDHNAKQAVESPMLSLSEFHCCIVTTEASAILMRLGVWHHN